LWCSSTYTFYACPDIPQQIAPFVKGNLRQMNVNPQVPATTPQPLRQPALHLSRSALRQCRNRNKYYGPESTIPTSYRQNFALSSDIARYLQIRAGKRQRLQPHAILESNRKLLIRQLRAGHVRSPRSSDTARSEDLLLTSQILS
jgi:hypothetical protein